MGKIDIKVETNRRAPEMNKKIIQFLSDAGYESPENEPAALQLIRYFEETYQVSLMTLLEQEWIDEQVSRELTHKDFNVLREHLDEGQAVEFDQAVAAIEAYE